MTRGLTQAQADAVAARLELDVNRVCPLCLSFVSFALDTGEPPDVARELRRMTPDIWEDGLDAQALAAAARACELGVLDAREALADLEQRGGKSMVARAIVRRLAGELLTRMQRSEEAA